MRYCRWYLVLIGLGLGVATTGLLFLFAWRDIFDILVTEEKSILPGTPLYKEWRRPSTHPTWQIYMYNWTNAGPSLDDPARAVPPSFEEVGPYTYDEHSEIVDVRFYSANGTLGYRKRTFFRRKPTDDGRNATGPEMITNVNYVALLASYSSRHLDYSVQRELSFLLYNHQQEITVTRPVGPLLFTGLRDPVLEQIRKLVCAAGGSTMPCQDERLSYFRTFNVSRRPSEVYTLDTGLTDRSRYGMVRAGTVPVNDGERQPLRPCDEGFDDFTGELFPSRIARDKPIRIVLPELCHRLTLVFEREQLVGDVVGYRYAVSFGGKLPTGTETEETPPERCPGTAVHRGRYGIVNSNRCNGLPLYESFVPDRDRGVRDDGKRWMYFVLEPTTGTLLESYANMTYHTVLRPNAHIALFQDVPELSVPLFRFTRLYRANELRMTKLKQLLHLLDVGHQMALAGCILGVAIVVLTAFYVCWNAHQTEDASERRNPNDQYSIVGLPPSSGGADERMLK